jgi:serine/threonine protein kinase
MDVPADNANEPPSDESSSSVRGAPRNLGEYRLLKRLGAGGMGRVYKAMHLRLEKLVAIKLLPRYRAEDPRALARFDREIKAAGRVNHPNVVQALDAREIEGTRFLVMEFVDGVNLSLLVRTCGRLEIADACELTRQAALGLQAAHEHGLVHRDIKPSNLMLSRAGQLKILDLGLARFRAEPAEPGEMTDVGETIGTVEYIAPEQVVDSHRVDIRADIYSLGCSMYRLLTGQPPFFGAKYHTAVEKMMAHLKEPLPPVRELRGDVSDALAAIIGRMVAKDPNERYAAPAEVAAALAPHAAGCDLTNLLNRYDFVDKTALNADPASSSAERLDSTGETKSAPAGESRPSPPPMPEKKILGGVWTIGTSVIALLALVLVTGPPLWTTNAPRADRTPEKSARESVTLSPHGDLSGKELSQNEWVDVLQYTDVDRDRISDVWEIRKDGIGCCGANGYPRFALPVAVHGDYDLELEFTRNSGDGLIRILAPVGDENLPQLLLAGGDGRKYGFNEFNGLGFGQDGSPSAVRSEPLNNGRRYTVLTSIRLHGKEATIDVALDGEPVLHCTAPPSAFPSFHSEDPAKRARPVVGVEAGSDVTFHSARVRVAGGNGVVKERRPTEPCPVGKWVDLLSRIHLVRDGVNGKFSSEGTELKLHSGGEQGTLMLPAAVTGSYELELEFAHQPADSMISLIVPVGLRRVRVNPNIRGDARPDAATVNQSGANGGGESDVAKGFAAGVRHKLALKVNVDGSTASLAVQIDGKPCLSWSGDLTELHDGPIVLPEGDRIGLVVTGSVQVFAARLRVTSGKALLVGNAPP